MPRVVARSFDNRSVIISRIMLRFRPIAPKPVGGEGAAPEQDLRGNGGRRTKRKYVRVRGRKSGCGKQYCVRRKKAESKKRSPPDNSEVEDASSPEKEVVTLQLLPERSERNDNSIQVCGQQEEDVHRHHQDNRNYADPREVGGGGGGEVATEDLTARSAGYVTETWIIAERVSATDTFGSGVGLGFSDKEKMDTLERDTCPGFVSDGRNKVIWVNEAYKRMVGQGETGFVVWLVVKESLPRACPSFACHVRFVQQRRSSENADAGGHGQSKIVPCDVWPMDQFAGFAWKLDLNTALSLSL